MDTLPNPENEVECYDWLVAQLHPQGIRCPQCGATKGLGIHRRHRAPVLDYQCGHCGRVFNAWTDTVLANTHRRPSEVVLILRGVLQGTCTAQLARELNCDRKHLLTPGRKLQGFALASQEDDPAL